MAKLRGIFAKGLETIFSVFEEAVKTGTYSIDDDNEFNDTVITPDSIRCIFATFEEKDLSLLSFSDLIQPSDILGLIPFPDVTLEMTASGGYVIFPSEGTYSVVGWDKDPLNVMYIVLLRQN